jgi:GMP synthase-like glutamine amidotransferase
MMSCSHLPEGATIFSMTTGTQPTGIRYGEKSATEVQFRIELASAIALDTLDRYESELLAEQKQLAADRPLPPPPPAPTT